MDGLLVPLPAALGCPDPVPFVERVEAWAALESAWRSSENGAPQLVLIAGEAGAGKTRLVSEFARKVHAPGAVVLQGGCSEEQTVPYQPFAEVLDHLLTALGRLGRTDLLSPQSPELARLVPGRGAPAASGAGERARPSDSADPDAERYRLFAAVTAALDAVAGGRPLLLVIEDLHWAARPTVQLLEHIARSPVSRSVCILATFRSTASDVSDAFRAVLPSLRRMPGASRVLVPGFDRDGVRRYVASAAGHPVHLGLERLVDVLVEETEGNPFLLGALWQHLVDTKELIRPAGSWRLARAIDQVTSPDGVRDVVAASLERLPADSRDVLSAAAVLGATFTLDVLGETCGRDGATVLAALDPARRAGLVEETGPGSCRFRHALVRRSVYDGLGLVDRRSWHREAARAIEAVRGEQAVAEIAHHLAAAVPLADPSRAVAAGRRAAAAATRAVAYDHAARHLEAVLPLVAESGDRCEILLEAAEASMRSGDVAAALSRCLEAFESALRLGLPELAVAAALAYDEANWRAAQHGTVAVQLLEDALPHASDDITRARLGAALARALAFSGRGEESRALAEDVLATARKLGDPPTLRLAFTAVQFAPWTPATLEAQVAVAREWLEVARREADRESEVAALDKLLYGLVFRGDLDEARSVAVQLRDGARRLGQPLFGALALQAQAVLAVGEGRFDDAELLAEEADRLSGYLSGSDMSGAYGVQLFSLRRAQGRLEEARPMVEAVAETGEEAATWRPALALLYAELGHLDAAAREIRHLAADGFAALPRDSLWWATLAYLADACAAVGDADAARAVYDELWPCRGLVIQVGHLLAAEGAADRHLGVLAALGGWPEEAEHHFEAALALETEARMPVWLARTQLAYGRFLSGGDRLESTGRARGLLAAALDTARSVGMGALEAAAGSALEQPQAPPGAPPGFPAPGDAPGGAGRLTDRERAVLALVAEGCSNREIGERLHISRHTAANHVRAILEKTGCENRTEAASWALRRAAVPTDRA